MRWHVRVRLHGSRFVCAWWEWFHPICLPFPTQSLVNKDSCCQVAGAAAYSQVMNLHVAVFQFIKYMHLHKIHERTAPRARARAHTHTHTHWHTHTGVWEAEVAESHRRGPHSLRAPDDQRIRRPHHRYLRV